jgi:hypothetical protein
MGGAMQRNIRSVPLLRGACTSKACNQVCEGHAQWVSGFDQCTNIPAQRFWLFLGKQSEHRNAHATCMHMLHHPYLQTHHLKVWIHIDEFNPPLQRPPAIAKPHDPGMVRRRPALLPMIRSAWTMCIAFCKISFHGG